jgi:hypothetical protein
MYLLAIASLFSAPLRAQQPEHLLAAAPVSTASAFSTVPALVPSEDTNREAERTLPVINELLVVAHDADGALAVEVRNERGEVMDRCTTTLLAEERMRAVPVHTLAPGRYVARVQHASGAVLLRFQGD